MTQVLNAYRLPLFGSRLIEASAGTGKTWTIAALYLRLVLGHGEASPEPTAFRVALMPAEILVMTFTRAATRELSNRIRSRLVEAARCFRGLACPAPDDHFLQALLAGYREQDAREWAAWRLATAAEAMDESAVFTIDAWCQRMLGEFAFDTGHPFDETLIADEQALVREAVQDYWRQQCYPLEGPALESLLAQYPTPDAMFDDVSRLFAEKRAWPPPTESLAECIERATREHANALAALSTGWAARVQSMRDWIELQIDRHPDHWTPKAFRRADFKRWFDDISRWAHDPVGATPLKSETARLRLSPADLLSRRAPGAPALELPDSFAALAQLLEAIDRLSRPHTAIRIHAAASVADRLKTLKTQSRTFGFSDIVERLAQALEGDHAGALRRAVLARYPVALIDEFQDTSPAQYRLFDALYRCADNDPQHALFLIGDPKQSIYQFRGADIHSYLRARAATAGRHYALDTNYRSTRALVDAVNSWFLRAEERRVSAANAWSGAFLFGSPNAQPIPFQPAAARGRAETFVTATGPAAAITLEHDCTIRSRESSRRLFAGRCAERIATWLNDPSAGFQDPDRGWTRLRSRHIAVLVRTGREAEAVRRELRRRNIASVYLSEGDSVFATDEASDLLRWLRAVAAPTDLALVRAALATRTAGLSLTELERLVIDDEAFDAQCDRLRQLRTVWAERGALAMMRESLHEIGLPARWRPLADGERRLTNWLHLAELLQNASVELDGEQALIRWLASRIAEAGEARAEDHLLRLESDDDLIQIVTVHKSKGLEYPVVCLPFACSAQSAGKRAALFVNRIDAQGERVLHLEPDADDRACAELEQLREELRLFYVAMTRAQHAIWMGFGLQKGGRNTRAGTHQSAAGRLLGGELERTPDDWLAQLQALARDAQSRFDTQIVLEAVPAQSDCSQVNASLARPALAARSAYAANFERHWSPASYSLLTRDLDDATFSPAWVRDRAADEDDAPPTIGPIRPIRGDPAPWHRFPGGRASGDFMHGLLEWLDREGFAIANRPALQAQLAGRCERANRGDWREAVERWLGALLETRLPSLGAPLSELRGRLPEMEFWMPAAHLHAGVVDTLCRRHLLGDQPRPALASRQLNGMLMGFADLVFEHQGRFWVLDYKTNQVGRDGAAYDRAALESEMARHRYDVQAALYLLALHRLLRSRLGAVYQPTHHLGGALYWFVRGIDGPVQGEYVMPANAQVLALLDALDGLLQAEVSP